MIGTIYGSARYGQLVAAINSSNCNASPAKYIQSDFSGTSEDAQVNTTLCRVGDEYVSYVDATLNGSGLYTLGGVLRGRFDDALAHNTGESFVRIDKAIFQHEFNSNLINKTLYLKFTSFNGLQQKNKLLMRSQLIAIHSTVGVLQVLRDYRYSRHLWVVHLRCNGSLLLAHRVILCRSRLEALCLERLKRPVLNTPIRWKKLEWMECSVTIQSVLRANQKTVPVHLRT